MGIRLSRTWLARGISAGVITFVVGAWAVGIAIGKDQPADERETGPASPESSLTPSEEPSVMGEREDRPKPSASPTDPTSAAESTDAVDDAETDEPADDDDPSTPKPKPTPRPSTTPKPRPTDKPTHTPSPSPSDPECNDLTEVLDCVLAPITTRP